MATLGARPLPFDFHHWMDLLFQLQGIPSWSWNQTTTSGVEESINQSIFVYLKEWYHNWHKRNCRRM